MPLTPSPSSISVSYTHLDVYKRQVQVVCPKCSKGTRVAHKIEGGKKTRVCKHCGAEL